MTFSTLIEAIHACFYLIVTSIAGVGIVLLALQDLIDRWNRLTRG